MIKGTYNDYGVSLASMIVSFFTIIVCIGSGVMGIIAARNRKY